MFLAAFDPRVKALVSSCGWTPFHDYYEGRLAGWAQPCYMPRIRDVYQLDPDRVPFDFDQIVASFAPRAFLSISPLADDNFSVAGVKLALPKAEQVYRLFSAADRLQVRYPDCGHDFPPAERQAAYAFLDRELAATAAGADDLAGELPRIAPREPAAASETFSLIPGFHVELAAAEPVVCSPVALEFDERGRAFVVEMRDYSEQEQDALGTVRCWKTATATAASNTVRSTSITCRGPRPWLVSTVACSSAPHRTSGTAKTPMATARPMSAAACSPASAAATSRDCSTVFVGGSTIGCTAPPAARADGS